MTIKATEAHNPSPMAEVPRPDRMRSCEKSYRVLKCAANVAIAAQGKSVQQQEREEVNVLVFEERIPFESR